MEEKKLFKKLLSLTRQAVQDYDLIEEGDCVCVGVSGGKDSMSLLLTLNQLRTFYPKRFDLKAVMVSLGFKDFDISPVVKHCTELGIEYHIVETGISEIVFNYRNEKNPCSLCANLRRGALNNAAKDLGCNVVALAHHKNDVMETAMMSLLYEGRFYCFSPKTFLDKTNLKIIRPFIYVEEQEIRQYTKVAPFTIAVNPCPMDKSSNRANIKELLKNLQKDNLFTYTNIFGAVKRDVWDR